MNSKLLGLMISIGSDLLETSLWGIGVFKAFTGIYAPPRGRI
jgi:hypothetical protein